MALPETTSPPFQRPTPRANAPGGARPQPPPRAPAAPPTPPTPKPMRFGAAATTTDVGLRMQDNEDAALAMNDVPLFALADGSGALWPAAVTLQVLKDQAPHISEYQGKVAAEQDTSSRLAVGHFF